MPPRPPDADSFHAAIAAGDLPLARSLRRAGCDVDAPDSNGCPPIVLAAHGGDLQIVKWLLSEGG